ncbi:MAG: AAA family ATPase [Cellulophaga sp.]|uniref:AAA family ATPase n=1 Tax=Cellulophaga sp. TaxID=1972202 RepID=UPI00326793CD
MKLTDLTNKIEVWHNWVSLYKDYVPKFIIEASSKVNWEDWDQEVFKEFFEKSNNQCVSSLRQGYYSKEEQTKIKNNWRGLAPLLKVIADNQEEPQWEIYQEITEYIRRFTAQNRKAATYRLIAGLQPNLLCTIVKDDSLKKLFKFINKNIEEPLPKYENNWFRDSHTINTFYKKHHPSQNYMDLISYPWQSFEYFKNPNSINENFETKDLTSMKQYIDLLHYKKQIILQGPPGTGKTRLAKLIAKELTRVNLTFNLITKNIKVGDKIANASGKADYYTILEITNDYIELKSERSDSWKPTCKNIIVKYNELTEGIEPSNKNGKEPYELAVAKHLFKVIGINNQNKEENFKVIQFHPSYTYEDFVRGIVVENNEEDKIEYKTKNRILAEYAFKALKNYNDFYKDESTFSKEVLLDEYFNQFVDQINEKIENDEGFFCLTVSVGLINTDEDAFRYKGKNDGWLRNGNRMLFRDIKQAFLDGNVVRQDLKKNENISGLAKQHASYYVRVLNLFQEFLKDNNFTFTHKDIQKEPLKNYVLIIDEINRANLSSVLGELIYALEYRGESVESMYEIKGNRKIILPPNLYIIGTMNTADRSVGQIDYAVRRRFAFVEVLPKILTETDLNVNSRVEDSRLFFEEDIFLKVKELFLDDNNDNSIHLSEEFEAKDVQLGHSYFIYNGNNFNYNLDYEIKPILREYVADGILMPSALKIIEDL